MTPQVKPGKCTKLGDLHYISSKSSGAISKDIQGDLQQNKFDKETPTLHIRKGNQNIIISKSISQFF